MLNAKLVVVGGDAKSAEVRLNLPTVIGRGKEAGLTVPHALVSRRHTEIFERDGRLFVRDLGSLNGTFVNNNRIEAEQPLDPNQLLTLGNITFRAVYEIAQTAVASTDGEPTDSAATITDNETVSFEEVETTTPNKKSDAIEFIEEGKQSPTSLSNMVSFDETVPLDTIAEKSPPPVSKSAKTVTEPKTKPQTRASAETVTEPKIKPVAKPQTNSKAETVTEPKSEPATKNEDSVTVEPVVADSGGNTNKSFVNPDSAGGESATSDIFVIETEEDDLAGKSVSVTGLDDLPTGQAAASFVGNLDLGDDGEPVVSQADPVEIDLGEEEASKVSEDSTLGSFLKKLPR